MPITADLHTHTTYSHGKGSPEDNVIAALNLGLREIAISEHASANLFYGIRGEKTLKLRREINRLNSVYGSRIRVLMGLECNLTGFGESDAPADDSMLDVVLLGYHRGVLPASKFALAALKEAFFGGGDPVRNARALLAAAEKKRVHILSHPGEYIRIDIDTLARGAAKLDLLLEINARHQTLDTNMLRRAADAGAKFIINSDAHSPDRVGVVGAAEKAAMKAGITGLVVNWRPD